ncbi:GTPase [Malikia spinosa]|jgi:small GTP-binding protein|uniref:GTPase n=1 Tax=Malikia spinosa TaxID=86180 RepID=UPI003FA2C8CE
MFEIIECISCKQKLRIPTSHTELEIKCPKCQATWNIKEGNKKMTTNEKEIIEEIKKRISTIRTYIPKIGVFGNSGVGKSSLCNALFGQEIAKISDVQACTREPQEILIGSSNGKGGIVLVDVPGIGENLERQKEYTELYKSLAPKLDLILWAIKADDRNYASGLEAYNEISKLENIPSIVFVVTQADKINPTREWNYEESRPGENQIKNIAIKENDVSRIFNTSTRNIISISTEESKYNLKELVTLIVKILPNEKKYSFTREAKKENVTEEAKIIAEKSVWESVKSFFGSSLEKISNVGKKIIEDNINQELIEKGLKFAAEAAVDFFKKRFFK